MEYATVLNGCSDSFYILADEMYSFLKNNSIDNNGKTIIFYCDDSQKLKLVLKAPTKDVILAKIEKYQPEYILDILEILNSKYKIDIYLFPNNYMGNELSVRLAYRLNGSSLISIKSLLINENNIICSKNVYSNNLLSEFQLYKKPYCFSIVKGDNKNNNRATIEHRILNDYYFEVPKIINFIDNYIFEEKKEEKESIENAKYIIVAGRGVKSKEKLNEINKIADKFGFTLGVTRPIAMNGWIDMNRLIGISGSITRPEICITIGVSGAAAFFEGIRRSKYIISINIDEKAPIIKKSDLSIIEDYENLLLELNNIVDNFK
jgi:electron transfer flavoprotein alpha subunit